MGNAYGTIPHRLCGVLHTCSSYNYNFAKEHDNNFAKEQDNNFAKEHDNNFAKEHDNNFAKERYLIRTHVTEARIRGFGAGCVC